MFGSPKRSKVNFPAIAENEPELMARHYTEARQIEKAIGPWGKALQRSALPEAVEQFNRALAQIAVLPSLYLDGPKLNGAGLPKKTRKEADAIVPRLTKAAQSGLLPHDGIAIGWRGGREPVNAVDTDDDALMAA
jgi:hypothetical protein